MGVPTSREIASAVKDSSYDKLKKYVGRKDYRLIYYWCELCRKENKRLESACEHCESLPDQSVIFFDLYHKKDSKRV